MDEELISNKLKSSVSRHGFFTFTVHSNTTFHVRGLTEMNDKVCVFGVPFHAVFHNVVKVFLQGMRIIVDDNKTFCKCQG